MSNSNFISLDNKINQLKRLTQTLNISEVCNFIFLEMFRFGRGGRVRLDSPLRQSQYLLAIMCSQEKTENTEGYTDDKVDQVCGLLNEIFNRYAYAYLPTKKDMANGLSEEWIKSRDVAMPMFLGYFFEGEKIATEELRYDITNQYERFAFEIKEHFGISHKDMLDISDEIGRNLQENFDKVGSLVSAINKKRMLFSNSKPEDYYSSLEGLKDSLQPSINEFQELMERVSLFNFSGMKGKFDSNTLEKFISIFVTEKGSSKDIHYITDENPLTNKPILTVDGDEHYLCSFNFLLTAIIDNIEGYFKKSKHAEKFRKHRDNKLESEVYRIFKEFLPSEALILESVFENSQSFNEHIVYERKILIIESKASPRREPLRDPTKAYQRIRDDFNKKSGIQSGYEQAHRLEVLLETNDFVNLYNKKGDIIATIDRADFDEIFCICVTKDDFGMLATNLSNLLQKDDESKYPWVICLHDLRFLISCLSYIERDWNFLLGYLRERISVFGKVMSNDELEFAGAFLKYGSFDFAKKRKEHVVFLDINESQVLDDIYFAKTRGEVYHLERMAAPYYELNKDKLFNKGMANAKGNKEKKNRRKMIKMSKRSNR
ncbi:hypothetical protein [Serratia fonticola]|uniref:hypothetical protein n=1 Tax=Serratia fonticola TaxID=47917 RepID=UPI00217711A3|nr:hypothetical protein [Serratia fonticola]CAI1626934.1 Uncharacterised protein [Serratia fonticola]